MICAILNPAAKNIATDKTKNATVNTFSVFE